MWTAVVPRAGRSGKPFGANGRRVVLQTRGGLSAEARMLRFLSVVGVIAVVILIPAFALAQEDSPKTGVLTGDKVRVRTGASTKHKILAELPKGAKVKVVSKVVSEKKEWYEIEMPDEVILVVSKNYLKETKKEGGILEGEVTGENVNVRTGTEATDERVGSLNKGDIVRIVGIKTGWYKIRPPKGFTAYISAEFVELGGGAVEPQKKTDTPKVSGDATDEKEKLLRDLLEQQKVLGDKIAKIKEDIEKTREEENKYKEKLRQAQEAIERFKKEQEEFERQAAIAREIIKTGTKPKPRYVAEGYVDDMGKYFNPPPATHRLYVTPGGKPRYFLKSADASVDLDKCIYKRVGVMGEVVPEEWNGDKIEVIKVTRIDILEE
jgi:uncharacterized protein YgiM (DUF1202 family)